MARVAAAPTVAWRGDLRWQSEPGGRRAERGGLPKYQGEALGALVVHPTREAEGWSVAEPEGLAPGLRWENDNGLGEVLAGEDRERTANAAVGAVAGSL